MTSWLLVVDVDSFTFTSLFFTCHHPRLFHPRDPVGTEQQFYEQAEVHFHGLLSGGHTFEQGKYHRLHVYFKRERSLPGRRGSLFILPRVALPFSSLLPIQYPQIISHIDVMSSGKYFSFSRYITGICHMQRAELSLLSSDIGISRMELANIFSCSPATFEPGFLPLRWPEGCRRHHREAPR